MDERVVLICAVLPRNHHSGPTLSPVTGDSQMQTFFGMILGALLLGCGVYVYDSMQTSSVANGEVATTNRTIVNWDVAKADWDALRDRALRRRRP